jgi:hypothetical protein
VSDKWVSCCEYKELKYSDLSTISLRSMAITTIGGERLRSRTINGERLFKIGRVGG